MHLTGRAREAGVPVTLQDGLVQYCAARRPMGGFLTAVVRNDLAGAVGRADPVSMVALAGIIQFLHNYAPAPCWGSPIIVDAWLMDPNPVRENYD